MCYTIELHTEFYYIKKCNRTKCINNRQKQCLLLHFENIFLNKCCIVDNKKVKKKILK